MKTLDETTLVEDTVENQQICKKYCGSCPTYKAGNLTESSPNTLFCIRRKSSGPSKVKTVNCYCPACEIFAKHMLIISYFCAR